MKVQVYYFTFLFLLILFLSPRTSPQDYIQDKIQFKRLTRQEGFPARNISYILQDSKGFLWMATPDGLIRFDGKKQKLFRYTPSNEKSIGSNTVVFIYEDRSGILWFATPGGGLNKYNSSEENFTRYTHNPNDPASISSNEVFSILEDKEGIFWIGTYRGGLNKFDPKSGKFSSYKNDASNINSLSNNNVSEVYEDSKGNLWIGTRGGGLNLFDREEQKFIRFAHSETELSSLSNNNVTGILEDNNGTLWISTMGGGLNKLTFKSGQQNPVFEHYKKNPNNPFSLSSNEINNLYLDRDNVFWVGTWGGGLNKMVPLSKENSSVEFISYKHDPLDIFSLTDNNVECIYEDNSGVLWISTSGAGLHIYDKNKKPFRLYVSEPSNPNSLGYTAIWSVYEDREGTRWIGLGDGGLNKMIKDTEKFIRYTHNPKNPYSISDNCVSTIYEDKFNNLWVGTWNGGLNKFNRKTGRFYKYKHDPKNPKSISDNRIFTIIEDASENLWIGTRHGGLNKFNRNDESFTHYRHNPDDPGSLSSDYASELYCDKNGNLLIATFIGLDLFDQKNENFIHLNLSEKNYPSNKDIRVTAIRESKSGFLWMGIMDLGLIKYDLKEGVKKTYTTEDGLPINYITGILEDEHENLWVSTTVGVSKFNPTTEKFRTYTYEDGLQGMNETKPFKSKTGELIFCGVMGLSIFHPDSVKDYEHIPPVYFTDFYLFNKPVPIGYDSLTKRTILKKSMVECDEIVLDYEDKIISFDFAILDFHSMFKGNRFAYIMEGFDKNWTYNETSIGLSNRHITYSNLSPGEYTLRVKAANSDHLWNEQGASIKIIILPPWYQTTLAYLIYIFLIGISVYFIWKTQIKRIKNKHEYEMSKFEAQKFHEVDELKSRFFANISHEFRTPLTLILGPAKQLSEQLKDEAAKTKADLIHRSAKKLNRLVDELLDISKIESGEMKLKACPINLVSAVREVTLYFSSLAETKNISFKVTSKEDEIITYVDKDKFDKILTNVISNAFKFTPEGGKVEVSIQRQKQQVEIKVTDTGMGIPPDQIDKIFDRFYQVDSSHTRSCEGTGIGLSLTKELIELHKGKIEVESKEGKGSIFRLYFLLRKAHLKPEEICEESLSQSAYGGIYKGEGFSEDTISTEETRTERHEINLITETGKPTLLIVEDNSDIRKYITIILGNQYEIFEAIDGEEGLAKSFKIIPDLIISDIMMPKTDGFQMCRILKTDERTSHIPIIMLTAKATMQDKVNGLELGADDYIMKPFEAEELKARINNLLEQRKRLHQHFQKYGLTDIDEKQLLPIDQKFLQNAVDVISKHISDTSFSVEVFADKLAVSRSLLTKKIEALFGDTPNDLIRRIRLNKAARLIERNTGNISEIALEVGFNNPSYFAECFKKQFGVAPSHYHNRE